VTGPVILDCDNAMGLPARDVGNGLALLFLLAQPEVALRGVTICFGNAPLPAVLRATRQLLDFANVPGLPLLAGAARPGAWRRSAFPGRGDGAEAGSRHHNWPPDR
jgi:purine nucleosidase